MQTNVIWTGHLYNSIENCIITETAQENNIVSTIIGWHENQLFKVDYHIRTNTNWETLFVQIRARLDDHTGLVTLERKNGQWLLNGEPQPAFHQLVHVDISLTLLPIPCLSGNFYSIPALPL